MAISLIWEGIKPCRNGTELNRTNGTGSDLQQEAENEHHRADT